MYNVLPEASGAVAVATEIVYTITLSSTVISSINLYFYRTYPTPYPIKAAYKLAYFNIIKVVFKIDSKCFLSNLTPGTTVPNLELLTLFFFTRINSLLTLPKNRRNYAYKNLLKYL